LKIAFSRPSRSVDALGGTVDQYFDFCVDRIDRYEGTGMKYALTWMLMALLITIGLGACIFVPVGGDDHHHGDGGHHEGHEDHYHDHDHD
jgi:hypothetical protein